MKKIVLMMVVAVAVSFSARAVDQTWNSLFTFGSAALGGEVDGTGNGWLVEIWDTTKSTSLFTVADPTISLGWITGLGYSVDAFTFVAPETDSVQLRLWNNATGIPGAGVYRLDSAALTLPVLTTPPAVGSQDNTFDLSGSTWQAIPEPATFMLFGIGGIGAWLIRRNKLQVKEEAEG